MKNLIIGILVIVMSVNGVALLGVLVIPLLMGDTVTLDAPYKDDKVNFFYRVHGGDVGIDEATSMPSGMICTRLDGPMDVDPRDGGKPISYYKLDCDGTVGYVNEQWVSRHTIFYGP